VGEVKGTAGQPVSQSATVSQRAGRRKLDVRVSWAAVDLIDERAAVDGIDRSDMIRRMLAYAARHMPRGWAP
jgi:hypothetical protein